MIKRPLKVSDVFNLHGNASIAVDESASLKQVIGIYAADPAIRGVFLVDSHRRLSSMVSRYAIQKWAQYQLFGKWDDSSCSEFTHIIDSVPAKQVAHGTPEKLGLKLGDELRTAFDKMMMLSEDVLPVVDDDGKIIGDLRLSEILVKALDASKETLC